jgi:hypothetical protein
MPSSGIWRRVAVVKTDVSEGSITFIISLNRISQLESTLAVTITADALPSSLIPSCLKMEVILSYETSVLTRTTRRHIPDEDNLHSHCRENLKSYITLTGWTL